MSQQMQVETTTNKELYRTGIIFTVLGTLSWVVWVASLFMQPEAAALGDAEGYVTSANSIGMLLYTWGGILGSLLFIPAFLTFYAGFQRSVGSVLIVPIVFGLIGTGLITLGFAVDTGSLIYVFGPKVAEATGADATLLATIGQMAQDNIEFTWGIGSFLEFGGPVVWIAWLLRRNKDLARWIHWAGIIGGLAGFVWIVGYVPVLRDVVPSSVGFILLFVNVIVVIVWFIALGVSLMRRNDPQPEVSGVQAMNVQTDPVSA